MCLPYNQWAPTVWEILLPIEWEVGAPEAEHRCCQRAGRQEGSKLKSTEQEKEGKKTGVSRTQHPLEFSSVEREAQTVFAHLYNKPLCQAQG